MKHSDKLLVKETVRKLKLLPVLFDLSVNFTQLILEASFIDSPDLFTQDKYFGYG